MRSSVISKKIQLFEQLVAMIQAKNMRPNIIEAKNTRADDYDD